MFCQRCGTALAEAAAVCPSCSTPFVAPAGASRAGGAARVLEATARDALAAFKTLAFNPVGGLPLAHDALGADRVLRTGVAFGVVSLVCFLLGGYLLLPDFMTEELFEFLGFGGVMKCLLFGIVPFACTWAGSLAVRKALGGQGSPGSDAFIAGSALLPVSSCMLVSGILGLGNYQAILVLSVFAGCTSVLMLQSGYTRISKLSERAGSIGVPIVVVLSAWLAKLIATSVLGGGGPADMDMYGDFPF